MKIYDFKNPADFKELEKQAYEDTIDCSRFPPAAYRYFSELNKLYVRFRENRISKSDAAILKNKLKSNYNEALSAYENWCDTYKAYQENIKVTDEIRSKICKSDSIADIADMAVYAVSIMTGDTVVYKIFKEKFKEADKI